ncbi:MAG TPA: hypothetical protein VGG76_09390 [Gemmatimonadaceae bacterium]
MLEVLEDLRAQRGKIQLEGESGVRGVTTTCGDEALGYFEGTRDGSAQFVADDYGDCEHDHRIN